MRHDFLPRARSHSSGFTLVELLIGTVILFVLALSLVESMTHLGRMTEDGSVDSRLQTMAAKAIQTITVEVKRSGFAGDYPWTFAGGIAGASATIDFSAHDHETAIQHGEEGDPDFGPSREIVFLQPADADDDDVPDVDGAGDLVWDASESSFVLVTRDDGINYLERRRDAIAPRVIAHHVERVTFETQNDDPLLPGGAVRVRLWLRERDDRGVWHRCFTEAMVTPRNGGGGP